MRLMLFIILIICNIASAQIVKVPDTGQVGNYTDTFGEDSDYSLNAPYFLENNNGTVTDNITKLMWQKQDFGDISWEAAKQYADTLTLAGYNDWRLPTAFELLGIINHDKVNPAINTEYFIKSEAQYWWSVDERSDDKTRIWLVNSGGGIGPHRKNEGISYGGDKNIHVRCVRNDTGSENYPGNLKINNDGTVADIATGLMWMQSETGKMTWEEALEYCETLEESGYDDWRLPNIKELWSLVNVEFTKPAVDKSFFSEISEESYWSSTTDVNSQERAWTTEFSFGIVSYEEKTNECYIRPVRNVSESSEIFEEVKLPDSIKLYQNYPNPFNPSTTIPFRITKSGKVILEIYNLSGKRVKTLINERKSPGFYNETWLGLDDFGLRIGSGIYLVKLKSCENIDIRKVVLVK